MTTTSTAETLEAHGITMSFGATEVLHGADLTVAAGSVVALVGSSGCGKTTLLRSLAGLEHPSAGEVRIGERVLMDAGLFVQPEKRRIGMVFQDAALFPHLSIGRNVAYGLARRDPERAARVSEALEMVGLAGYEKRMPATLSGGQMQRVALARALAPRPSVVLLDEPFSSLDAPLRAELRVEVGRLLTHIDATAVFVTHDQEEAFVVGDEIAVMDAGVIAHQGTPTGLYELPATRAVAEFVGDANFLPGTAHGTVAVTPLGPILLHTPVTGPVDVLLRPEDVRVGDGDAGTVDHIDYFGHDAVLHVQLHSGAMVRSRAIGPSGHAAGDHVGVTFAGRPTIAYPTASPPTPL